MSTTDLAPLAAHAPRPRRPVALAFGRLLRSELRLVLGRRRTQMMLLVLAAVPVLIGVAIRLATEGPEPGEGPPFLDRVSGNGLFLAFTATVATVPLFLPLVVGVASGDAVAGEASTGTLRYLLVVPVHRARLLAVKYAALVIFCLIAASVVAATGAVTGWILFGITDVTLLSGTTVSVGEALLRTAAIAAYVGLSMAALAAVGLAVSTLTEVPVAAMATTVTIAVASQVLDALPQVAWMHPYLLTHRWLAFGDLLRDPVDTAGIAGGLGLAAAWAIGGLALAWARFATRDVTS